MSTQTTCDEDLVRRLPLPLAKIYRRAHSARAKSALELHQAAYYLWEASLKLLGSTAIVAYAERGEHDSELAECLKKICRPMLGNWWEFARRLLPVLADGGDTGFVPARDLVLGRERNDLPKTAALGAALLEARGLAPGSRSKVRLSELFDRLVKYRNDNPGHGALGMGSDETYHRMGLALLSAGGELLAQLDVLAGRRLVYVKEVRRRPNGGWLVERFELTGESPRQIESLELPERDAGRLPHPGKIYLEPPDAPDRPPSTMLHPLAVYDPDEGMVLFLNARRKNRSEYLSYTSGRHFDRDDLGEERRTLLARILDTPLDEAELAALEAESSAEQERNEPSPADLPAEVPLRSLGEFELLSELGRGSMGVVYRAWQPSLGRQVALKRSLRTGDPKTEQRFQREIRAMGKVDHPQLVKVFSSGFEGEHWYYAMELVEGATLSAVCDALHTRSSTAADVDLATWRDSLSNACASAREAEKSVGDGTPPALPTRATSNRVAGLVPTLDRDYIRHVVELLRQSAEAAHVLHGVGVIHRDIKPGNIMVTGDGTHAVLIDLGLAQLADVVDGKLTRTRQFLGTIRYADPEQVISAGQIDHRSDIYSLGATLWELLTLRPLFGATDATPTHEVMNKVPTEEPERVRRYNPKVTRDLESIVHKCLEKTPARRYATAAELADDLGRYLRGEVVLAQPPSFGYQASKFVRRHKAPLATAAAVLLLIVMGTVAAFLNIHSEHRKTLNANKLLEGQQRVTEKALMKSEANFKLAEQRFGEKRAALDEMLHRFSDDSLKLMPGAQEVRQAFLVQGIDLYKQILNERRDDPNIRPRLAEAYLELGQLQSETGTPDKALDSLRQAVDYRRQIANSSPADASASAALGDSLFLLGQYFWEQQRLQDALPPIEESVSIYSQLVKAAPDDPRNKAGLGQSLTRLVSVRPDKTQETKDLIRARSLLADAAAALPGDADVLTALARAINNYSASIPDDPKALEEQLGLYDEARRVAEKALVINRAHSVAHDIRAQAIINRAMMFARSNREAEGLSLLREAAASGRGFVRANPAVVRGYRALNRIQTALAAAFDKAAMPDEAIAVWEEMARTFEAQAQRDPRNASAVEGRIDALYRIYDKLAHRDPHAAGAVLDRISAGDYELMHMYNRAEGVFERLMRAYRVRALSESEAERPREAVRHDLDALSFYETHAGSREPVMEGPLAHYIFCAGHAVRLLDLRKEHAEAARIATRAATRGEGLKTPALRRLWVELIAAQARNSDLAGQPGEAITVWKRVEAEAERRLREATNDFHAHKALSESLAALVVLHRRVADATEEARVARELLRSWTYLDGKDRTHDLNDSTGLERLRALVNQPPTIRTVSLRVDHGQGPVSTDFYFTDSIQTYEDQFREIEQNGGTMANKAIGPEFFRDKYKKAHDQGASFADYCFYVLGTGRINDESLSQLVHAQEESTRLTRELAAAPGDVASRRGLAKAHAKLASLYAGQAKSQANALREIDEALSLIDLDDRGEPRDPVLRETLASLRLTQFDMSKSQNRNEAAYVALIDHIRLFGPEKSAVRDLLAATCRKLGRDVEAAFWLGIIVADGSVGTAEEVARLYLDKPQTAAALPVHIVEMLRRVDGEIPPVDRNKKFVSAFLTAWKNDRADRILADVSRTAHARVRAVLDLGDMSDRALSFLDRALKANPNDPRLLQDLGDALSKKEKWAEAVEAYGRSLTTDAVSEESGRVTVERLEAWLLSGDACGVIDEVARLDRRGWSPSGPADRARGLVAAAWGLAAIAAAADGRDHLPALARATASAPEQPANLWIWYDVERWADNKSLPPPRRKAIASSLDELRKSRPSNRPTSPIEALLSDDFRILLLRGKNTHGDRVYAYVKIRSLDVEKLESAMKGEGNFNLGQFGEIIAAGRGEPPADVKRDVDIAYPTIEP